MNKEEWWMYKLERIITLTLQIVFLYYLIEEFLL